METKAEVIAFHGWGLDASFWSPWDDLLPAHIEFKKADRGYFGKAITPSFSSGAAFKILFVHSYGLHWCPEDLLKKADFMIIFSSYRRYFPKSKKRLLEYTLEERLKGFNSDPEGWLTAFLKLTYKPANSPNAADTMNKDKLMDDLEDLHLCVFPKDTYSYSKLIVLEAEDDLIFPESRRIELEDVFGKIFHYEMLLRGGHAFPKTAAGKCYSILKKLLPIFEEQ